MKAIHADPKEIRKLFTDKFIIPDFQRPYSWDIDQCDKLWEDFVDFFNDIKSEDNYFLGNIVINPVDKSYSVIDGQQRLTTLLLVIKALHQKAGTVHALEKCLKVEDPLTSKLTSELRIQSFVLEDDNRQLGDVIFNNGNNTLDGSKIKKNYIFFENKISEWWQTVNQSTAQLNNLILTLLDRVVLLPIHCGSEDDALTIFETINNRGMSLTDADIFKAKLHHAASNNKDEFVQQWNSLEDHVRLFRVYMHVLRAKENDISKEIGLRVYFSNKSRFQNNWESVMSSLKKIYEIDRNLQLSDETKIWWEILRTYPNYYWNYPLYVFLHKHCIYVEGDLLLPERKVNEFNSLIKETAKYFFIKGIVHNTVNVVRDTVFKVCSLIEKDDNYLFEYKNNCKNDVNEFFRRIDAEQYGRYQKGLVLIGSLLNPNQDYQDYFSVLNNNYHIEHILPKKWNNYDEWTNETWQNSLNTLGNLIPLEWNLNISAKNEFFLRKKDSYKDSKVQDAKDLLQLKEWKIQEYNKRHQLIIERIKKFFSE